MSHLVIETGNLILSIRSRLDLESLKVIVRQQHPGCKILKERIIDAKP